MDLMHAVKKILSTVGSKTRFLPKSPRPGAEAEKDRAEARGLESRCVNPEYGCRFEVS